MLTSSVGRGSHLVVTATPFASTSYNVGDGGYLELNYPASPIATVINMGSPTGDAAVAKLDDPSGFHGTVNFNDGLLDLSFQAASPGVLDWHLNDGFLNLDGRGGTVARFAFNDVSPTAGTTDVQVSSLGSHLYVTEGALHQPPGATLLYGGESHIAAPGAAAMILDTTTQVSMPDTFSHAYAGPVVGVQTELIDITPHSLNITATKPNLFIKTGDGNDAVALSGGINVVDAGGGSNFLTGAAGPDTFFLDARHVPKIPTAAGPVPGSIWDTVEGLGVGDAVTFWGVNASNHVSYAQSEGAVGHTGITMHVDLTGGGTASLTLPGFRYLSSITTSYGSSGGDNYMYVTAR